MEKPFLLNENDINRIYIIMRYKRFLLEFFAFVAIVVFSSHVNAQCNTGCSVRRASFAYSTTYQYPVREVFVQDVITPIAIPVLVPAYQFQYVAPCAGVAPVAATPIVPVTGVPMQQVSYAPGGSIGASQMSEQERIQILAKAIISEMNKQVGQGGQNVEQDNGPPMAIDGAFNPQPQFGFMNVLGNRCASCHTGPSSKGGVQIFSSPGIFNTAVDRQRIVRAMEDGRMPPRAVIDPSHRVPVQEIEIVKNGLR